MIEKIGKFVGCIVLLVSASYVNAGGWAGNQTIKKVAFNTGGFFLYADNWNNPNSCTRTDAVVLLSTDQNYDKAYALVLSAYMSGKKIKGYSDSCVTFDGQTYNMIRGTKYLYVE